MNRTTTDERFSATDPAERVLLLSHCSRPSQACPGKMGKQGMVCVKGCREDCAAGRLQRAALALGYKGVCIAAGGAMAVRFVRENAPRAILAVACDKELAEGIQAVAEMSAGEGETLPIVAIPLLTDGCVDTKVDEERVLAAIALGCRPMDGKVDPDCAP